MARAKIVVDGEGKPYGVRINCPGCGDHHVLPTVPGHGPQWQWNGDLERPVFSPSLLVTSGHYMDGSRGGTCWCTYNVEHPDDAIFTCYRCHSFIGCNGAAPGQIIFLSDCTHALAGQTIDLPEIEPC